MNPIDRINLAETIAPVPTTRHAGTDAWIRHYAALGLAAYAAFQDLLADPELSTPETVGYLVTIGQTATAAAAALVLPSAKLQWDLTPEAGALNGEWSEWLVGHLDDLGVNPADIDDRYLGADFRSPRAQHPRDICQRGGCDHCGPTVYETLRAAREAEATP